MIPGRAAMAMAAVLMTQSAAGYELATHARITDSALRRSTLGADTQVFTRLGIDLWATGASKPFRTLPGEDIYFDVSGTEVRRRLATSYEQSVIKDIGLINDSFKIVGWMMRGTIREDDGSDPVGRWKGEPLDDPYFNFNRFCNHFYDPAVVRSGVGRAYSEPCGTVVVDAVQWALGSVTPFDTQPPENLDRRNHFSLLDAREAMWRALTLKDRSGAPVLDFGMSGEDVRKAYWATTFRALGDVVHLIQDMGQPQHTRNEGHPGNAITSGYEEFADARARQAAFHRIDGLTLVSTLDQLPDLPFTGHAIPIVGRYSDLFSTSVGNVALGRGLADYSNRNFFTPASNIGNSTYPYPTNNAGAYVRRAAPANALPYDGMTFTYLYGNAEDKRTEQIDEIAMTTEGVFSEPIQQFNPSAPLVYALNRKNYDDRAALLIPRAVAYSAGLINYFFRGTMQIGLPAEGVYGVVDHSTTGTSGGFSRLKVKVKNTTPKPEAPTEVEAMDLQLGGLYAVAKFHSNTCYSADLSREYGSEPLGGCRSPDEKVVVSTRAQEVPATVNSTGGDVTFDFTTPVPISATDLFLQVVYRGPLGNETDAVVVETKDISEPSYYPIFDRYEQFNWGGVLGGEAKTWKQVFCDEKTPPIPYEQCKKDNANNYYLRFAPAPSTYDPADPVNSFKPLVTMTAIPVSSYPRVAILTDTVPFDAYLLDMRTDTPSIGQTGPFTPARNQIEYSVENPNGILRMIPRYREVRRPLDAPGVWVEDLDYTELTTTTLYLDFHLIPPITPLEPKQSQINFPPTP